MPKYLPLIIKESKCHYYVIGKKRDDSRHILHETKMISEELQIHVICVLHWLHIPIARGGHKRFEITTMPLTIIVLYRLPYDFFMNLRFFVSVTWLKYRIPRKIYANWRITAQIFVQYRMPNHYTAQLLEIKLYP